MKTSHIASHIASALILAGFLTGPLASCASTSSHQSTGEYIDDSAISNKVRGELIGDKDLNVFKIDVTTYNRVVQLSGVVNSQSIKAHAGKVAANVQGVKDVRNDLVVK